MRVKVEEVEYRVACISAISNILRHFKVIVIPFWEAFCVDFVKFFCWFSRVRAKTFFFALPSSLESRFDLVRIYTRHTFCYVLYLTRVLLQDSIVYERRYKKRTSKEKILVCTLKISTYLCQRLTFFFIKRPKFFMWRNNRSGTVPSACDRALWRPVQIRSEIYCFTTSSRYTASNKRMLVRQFYFYFVSSCN